MGLNCKKAEQLIQQQVDGELSERDAARLASHLEGCAACRQQREELETVVSALRELPRTPLPDDFQQRLVWRIKARQAEMRSKRRPIMPLSGSRLGLVAAAAILLVCLIGVQEILQREGMAPQLPPVPADHQSRVGEEGLAEPEPGKAEKEADQLADSSRRDEQKSTAAKKDHEKGSAPAADEVSYSSPPRSLEISDGEQMIDGRAKGRKEARQRGAPAPDSSHRLAAASRGGRSWDEGDLPDADAGEAEEMNEEQDPAIARGLGTALSLLMPTHSFQVVRCEPAGPLVEADQDETCAALAGSRVLGELGGPLKPRAVVHFRIDLSLDSRGGVGVIAVTEGAPPELPGMVNSWTVETATVPEGGLPATLRIDAKPRR